MMPVPEEDPLLGLPEDLKLALRAEADPQRYAHLAGYPRRLFAWLERYAADPVRTRETVGTRLPQAALGPGGRGCLYRFYRDGDRILLLATDGRAWSIPAAEAAHRLT